MPAPLKRPSSGHKTRGLSAMQSGAILADARRGPSHAPGQRQQLNQAVKLATGLAIGLGLVLGIVFGVKAIGGKAAPVLGNDALVLKEMKRVSYDEANSWFSQGHDRVFVGHSKDQTRSLIDQLYGMKPKRVLAGGGRMSMHVVIELPEVAESRARLFSWHNEWLDRYSPGSPHERDVGQRYLMAQMPLNR